MPLIEICKRDCRKLAQKLKILTRLTCFLVFSFLGRTGFIAGLSSLLFSTNSDILDGMKVRRLFSKTGKKDGTRMMKFGARVHTDVTKVLVDVRCDRSKPSGTFTSLIPSFTSLNANKNGFCRTAYYNSTFPVSSGSPDITYCVVCPLAQAEECKQTASISQI